MSLMSRNDDPPEDDSGAVEIRVEGQWFALDGDMNVYQYCGNGENAERDDGYKLIGRLEPQDEPECDSESHFRFWLIEYLQNHEVPN